MGIKGRKSLSGKGEIYQEAKDKLTLNLTPTAIRLLTAASKDLDCSRSEVVERMTRLLLVEKVDSLVMSEIKGLSTWGED